MRQEELKRMSLKLAKSIREVKNNDHLYDDPFPHFFIDDCFEVKFLDKIISSFPSIDSAQWDVSNE